MANLIDGAMNITNIYSTIALKAQTLSQSPLAKSRSKMLSYVDRARMLIVDNFETLILQKKSKVVPVRAMRAAPPLPEQPYEIKLSNFIRKEYIEERLDRYTTYAQNEGNYYEMIRLEMIASRLKQGLITPVQAAREAWFAPLRKQ